jgi:hypothetical protein
MYLAHFRHNGGVFEFDPVKGSVSPVLAMPKEKLDWGRVCKKRGQWFVIWNDSVSLLFQHGKDKWRLDQNVEVRTGKGLLRRFEIDRRGNIEFSFGYLAIQSIMFQIIDPTYNASWDDDTDDFFTFVTSMWEAWKAKDMALFNQTEPHV